MEGLQKEDIKKMCCDEDETSISVTAERGWCFMEGSVHENVQVHGRFHAVPSVTHRNLRVFAGTWNVGGRTPDHQDLSLREWLMMRSSPSLEADMYVLGFQEIVPLNSANVLCPEDKITTTKWLSLISDALEDRDVSRRRCSSSFSEEEMLLHHPFPSEACPGSTSYRLVASKQMVGIFLCVWVRAELMPSVSCINVSCVGTGIMGCMGNKGSVSISMTMEQTTLCFVCTHLASGERELDRSRRNSDVIDILKRTRFPRRRGAAPSPTTILQHDRIIWLGDLNYRLVESGCRCTLELLQKRLWMSLLEKDELQMEQRDGVLVGWEEGKLNFPPTYKYLVDSDQYAIKLSKSGNNRRTPAWCDRILWRGKGMKQTCYGRVESRFSDHRPVYSVFDVEIDDGKAGEASEVCRRSGGCLARTVRGSSTMVVGGAHCKSSGGRVEAEELLSGTRRAMSCLQVSRF